MKIQYLEIVTPNVDETCAVYEAAHDTKFSDPDPLLGGAKTCRLADGSMLGVRPPMRETEEPVVRPYWLVEDIDGAVDRAKAQGAEVAIGPLEIPSKGTFAIVIIGGVDHGFWQS